MKSAKFVALKQGILGNTINDGGGFWQRVQGPMFSPISLQIHRAIRVKLLEYLVIFVIFKFA